MTAVWPEMDSCETQVNEKINKKQRDDRVPSAKLAQTTF